MDKYAVIGNPVKHSLSPKIHQLFANQTGLQIEYIALEAPLDGFENTVKWFRAQGGKGCNVTVPFKPNAFALANKMSNNAKIARSVNCLLFKDDGSIWGENFDGVGLVQDLNQRCHFDITHKRILIIGAGGATQGILGPLLEKAPLEIIIANRTLQTAIDLAARFKKMGAICGVALSDLSSSSTHFDLIIHATSSGHYQQLITLPDGLISDTTLCYDLSYGEAAKSFLNWAKNQNAKQIHDGIGMLVEQAAASFYFWLGIYPNTKPIFEQL